MADLLKKGVIAGAGGGGGKSGGGSGGTPSEDPDSLKSRSMVSLLDLISEGQIGGLVKGGQSVFFGDDFTPLMNPDGTANFNGVTWDFRVGTQDQKPILGFDQLSTPFNVSLEVKQATPKVFSIDNDNADQVKVVVMFPKMTTTDLKTGDTHGSRVQFKFQMAYLGKDFADVIPIGEQSSTLTVDGKRSSRYYASYTFNLPKPATQYRFRMTRLSPDSSSDYVQNTTILDSYYEIVDSRLSYPNSALFGVKIDSSQFNQIPTRSFLIDGLMIRVPNNYHPESNTYVGTWDGGFNVMVSSNPAWILYDLLTNKRYGLGQFVPASLVPIGKLYQIGRYCDQEVPDGFNGTEKRFSLNTVINSRADAYKVIQDIASAFRGMIFWSGGMVNVTQDSPEDPEVLFGNANIIGDFNYAGTARKDRHSVALITWNDPADNYRQAVEYVEDPEAIALFGIRKTESIAFGCTSRGQAHRVGLWTLYSERLESDVVSFEVGIDSAFVVPGQVVKIQDRHRSGRRMSGRLTASSKSSITLDQEVTLVAGGTGNWISVMMPDGKFVDRKIDQVGKVKTINLSTANLPDIPVDNAMWTITQPDLVPLLARIIEIKQGDKGNTFKIAAVQHNPSKYSAIENGTALDIPKTTILDPTFSVPENLRIDEMTYFSSPGNLGSKLQASWEGRSSTYVVRYRRADTNDNWRETRVHEELFELLNVVADGVYDFEVYALATSGRATEKIVATYKVLGTTNPPGAPANLTAIGDYRSILLNWSNPGNLDLDHTEVWAASANDISKAAVVARVTGTNWTHAGLDDNVELFYWIKSINKRGMASPFNSNVGTSARTKDVLSFLKDKITSSELSKELMKEIDDKATKEALQAAKDQLEAADKALDAKIVKAQGDVGQVQADLNAAKTELRAADAALDGKIVATNTALNQAKTDLQAADAALNTRVDAANTKIDNAVTNLNAADAALDGKIAALDTKTDQAQKDLQASVDITNKNVEDAREHLENVAEGVINNSIALDKESQIRKEKDGRIIEAQKVIIDDQKAIAEKVTQVDANFNNQAAKIVTLQKAMADGDSALAQQIQTLDAKTANADKALDASIKSVQTAQVDGDKALAESITGLDTKFTGITTTTNANITTLQKTVADGDSALATRIDGVSAKTDTNAANITSETTARANADSALSTRIDNLSASTGGNAAAIQAEIKARTDADSALGQRIDTVKATTDGNTAAITAETTARTNADSALGTRIDSVKTTTDGNTAAIQSEVTARTNADSALSTRIDSVKATTDGNTAAISTEVTARTNADSALSTRIDSVKATADNASAGLATEITTRANADTALGTLITNLRADMNTADAQIGASVDSLTQVVAQQNDAMAQKTDSLKAQLDNAAAGIVENTVSQDKNTTAQRKVNAQIINDQKVMVSTQQAQASTIQALTVNFNGVTASIKNLQEVTAAADLALSNRLTTAESTIGANTAAIQTEATTRATADSAMSTRIDTVSSKTDGNTASITALQKTVTDGDSALATQISGLNTRVGNSETAISNETTARTNADSALGTRIDSVKTTTDGNTAAINTEVTARTNADSALSTRIDTVKATADGAAAGLSTETTARINADGVLTQQVTNLRSDMNTADSALSADITTLSQTVTKNNESMAQVSQQLQAQANAAAEASINNTLNQDERDKIERKSIATITTKQSVIANDVMAQATRLTMLQSDLGSSNARITQLAQTTATADAALATQINSLQVKVDTDITAAINSEATVRANADGALGTRIDTVKTTTDNNTAAIGTEITARTNADSALSTRIDSVKSVSDKAAADITTEVSARTTADSALGTRIDGLNARVGTAEASITSEATTRANADSALSSRVDTVTATANGNTSKIQTVSQAQQNQAGKLNAMWSVKMSVDSNGRAYAAGIGLGIENMNGSMQSQFLIQADRMALINNVNGNISTPFVVDGGVTYMNAAFIKNATIDNGKIAGDLWSSNYDWATGNNGWLLGRGGYLTIGTKNGGGRMRIEGNRISVFDGNGTLRVQIGELG